MCALAPARFFFAVVSIYLAGMISAFATPVGSEMPTSWTTISATQIRGTTPSGIVVTATLSGGPTWGSTTTPIYGGPQPSYIPNGAARDLSINCASGSCGTLTYTFSRPVLTPVLYLTDMGGVASSCTNGVCTTSGSSHSFRVNGGFGLAFDTPTSHTTNTSISGGNTLVAPNPVLWTASGGSSDFNSCGANFGCAAVDVTGAGLLSSLSFAITGTSVNGNPGDGIPMMIGITPPPTLQLAKSWGAGSVAGDVANLGATTGGTNNTAAFSSTAPTAASSAVVSVMPGNTIGLPAETMSVGSLASYTTTLSCTANGGATANALSGTNGQQGNTLLIGNGDLGKAIVCTYTNIRQPVLRLQKALPKGRFATGDQFALSIVGSGGPATATTTGTDTTATGQASLNPATSGATYTLSETGAAGADLANYTVSYACTNLRAGGQTPSGSGTSFSVTPVAGDDLTCTFSNTRAPLADLTISKTNTPVAGPNDQSDDTLALGQTTTYTVVVTNRGPDAVTGAVLHDPIASRARLSCSAPAACSGTACPASSLTLAQLDMGVTLGSMAVGDTVTTTVNCTVQ
ncbi:prealbumin-like fold domain-containing protein [Lysobacter sp. CA196]|uniref:prealbumin-like fold domain-containing protein n=1 Tax=Lysobacter sp. CA196 TaxID=3455606 RepID=UPI003F8D0AEE